MNFSNRSIDFFFQCQLWSFKFSLSKNKNLHILKNLFVQMSVYFQRSIEKSKNMNVFKSNSSQKFFQIESVSEFHLKSITFYTSSAFVSDVWLMFHKNFYFIQFFFDLQSIVSVSDFVFQSKHNVRFSTEINRHDFVSLIQFVFVFEIRLIFHKNSSYSIQFRFDAQSSVLKKNFKTQLKHNVRFSTNINQHNFVSSNQSLIFSFSDVQSVFDFFEINVRLILNYLSN